MQHDDYDWTTEDPGRCVRCGAPFELVRPGKSQPTCDCWEIGPEPMMAECNAEVATP